MVVKKENNGQYKKNEELLHAYQAAINLQIFEGSLVWSRFDAMVIPHTIFFVFIGMLYEKNNVGLASLTVFKWVLPILGILLCILWFFMTSRGYSWFKYWSYSARELEDKIRKSNMDIMTLKKGNLFKDGQPVKFDFEEYKGNKFQVFTYQRPWYSRGLVTHVAAYFTIGIFALIYIILLLIGWNIIKV